MTICIKSSKNMKTPIFPSHPRLRLLTISRNTQPISYSLLALLLFVSACKKDNKEITEEEYPVFGTCKPVTASGSSSLSLSGSNAIFTFETSGGGKIVIDPEKSLIISHKDYPGFQITFWGSTDANGQEKISGGHENLNGKHIKDRRTDRRTIIFPEGTKITMAAVGKTGQMLSISIYDGNQFHRFNPTCNTLEYSSVNSPFTKQLDDAEADGETGTFEFTQTGLLYLNIYTEDVAGQKVEKRIPIGEIYRDQPNRVDDYYP